MDWSSLIIGVIAGLFVNLLTPSVQRALAKTINWSGTKINHLSHAGLRLRLQQLEEEHAHILKLKNNPPELIALAMGSVMSVIFMMFIIMVTTFILIISNIEQPTPHFSPWYGAIGGMFGLGTRWLIGAMVALGTINKVKNFNVFEIKNLADRQKIEGFLG